MGQMVGNPKVTVIPARPRMGIGRKNDERQKIRVAAYCRVSTDSDEQATSYEAQIEHYTAFIKKNPDWEFAGIFADDGISGTDTRKREEFNRMIEECMKGKIQMVITKSISRFARNTLDCLKYIRQLKDRGIPVFFEKENINTMDAKGEVMLTIMASLAQQESESLSQNVKIGLQYRYQQGLVQVNHNRFLGYTKDAEGHLVIKPEEAEVVKRIYREYLEGASLLQIGKGLEADGILTGAGKKKWRPETIKKILQNEKYIGDALLAKTYTVDFLTKKRVKNNGIVPQYYVENSHEPIVPRDLYMQVQEEIARRGMLKDSLGRRKCFSSAHAFSQITFCSECGAEYSRLHWNNRGKKSIVWRCSTRLNNHTKCNARTVKENDLQQAFVDALHIMIGDSTSYLKRLQGNLNQIIVDPCALQKIDEQLNNLQYELLKRTENHEDYTDIADEIFSLREQREKIQVSKSSQAEYKKRIDELQFFIKSHPDELSYDETLAKHLLSKITIFDDHIVFEFKSGVTVSVEK